MARVSKGDPTHSSSTSFYTKPPVRHGRRPAPLNETRRERFLRLGQPRMARAIKAIQLLGNLARGHYEWTERDVILMEQTLKDEIAKIVQEFHTVRTKKVHTFNFG